MPEILLIDDDERLADLVSRFLESFNFQVHSELHPRDGLQRLEERAFDLVILDVMLPDMDGFEVCREIRKNSNIPIIMLTARGDVLDRVVGLELGADDYLPKPFEPRELAARIQSILKRVQHNPQPDNSILRFDRLQLDINKRRLLIDDEEVSLSGSEFELLTLLASNPGKTFDRDEILNELKGIDAELFSRSVDILVSRLRQKLKPLEPIQTMRGKGYRFSG